MGLLFFRVNGCIGTSLLTICTVERNMQFRCHSALSRFYGVLAAQPAAGYLHSASYQSEKPFPREMITGSIELFLLFMLNYFSFCESLALSTIVSCVLKTEMKESIILRFGLSRKKTERTKTPSDTCDVEQKLSSHSPRAILLKSDPAPGAGCPQQWIIFLS